MRTLLAAACCLLTLGVRAWADQPQTLPSAPPNTAAKAAAAALAFLAAPDPRAKGQGGSEAAFQQSWDVTAPAAAVRQRYRAGLDGLQTGDPALYLALLSSDYQQSGADKTKTARRLTEMLALNQCASAKFSITSTLMQSDDRLLAQVWQEFVFTSKNTPATYVTASPGKTFAVNQTGRLTVTQSVQEEWVRTGAGWQMRRAETLAQKATAVL